MAVELCKVALWMEALEPGRPLSFLDAHIRCGNSLLGTTPELLGAGIPDDAYKPLEGDQREITTELRRRNRQERDGQLTIDEAGPLAVRGFLESALNLEAESANSIAAVHAQEQGFLELFNSAEYQRTKLLSDAWCYAFVNPKRPDTPQITQGLLRLMSRDRIEDSALVDDIKQTAAEYRFFHWNTEFPTVFGRDLPDLPQGRNHGGSTAGFDVVLGNPPFVNAIEGGINEGLKRLLRFTHPHIGGTADLSYYFLSAALMHVRKGGRIGLVQPRALLNATPASALRSGLPAGFRPNLLYAPPRSDFFAGPAVFIALVVLGPDEVCLVSRDVEPATAVWKKGVIANDNWWLAIGQLLEGHGDEPTWEGPSVGDVFTVVASMTTADAYDVAGAVNDECQGSFPKLVTTGLIDPGLCLWGKVTCRYLKRDYQCPRINESHPLTNSLRRRIAESRRPKILVAGLSKRVECFVDRAGEYVGAVSTYSVFHPTDDVAALEALCAELLSEESSRRFVAELGGSAMGGGNTTMKKSFLASLPYRSYVRR
jgi:hypothetical protein